MAFYTSLCAPSLRAWASRPKGPEPCREPHHDPRGYLHSTSMAAGQRASQTSGLTAEQAAVQHATPAVRYKAEGDQNPAHTRHALPGFSQQEPQRVEPQAATASQTKSSALLAQLEAKRRLDSVEPQMGSVSRSSRGKAAEVQPPPAYMYDFPDTTLWEVQHSLELQFSRGLKMVALLPSCLRCGAVHQLEEAACAAAMMAACSATAPLQCFQSVAERACGRRDAGMGSGNGALGLYTALQRTFPLLQEAYQWKGSQVVYSWLDDGLCDPEMEASASRCPHNITEAKEQLKGADVIFADVRQLDHVASHFPRALLVVMDVSDSASMHPELLQKAETLSAARVLRVVKPHVLRPLGLNLPPLFEGCAHLAAIPGVERASGYQRHVGWDIPDTVLSKPLLGLNPILRYRHFLDLGSSLRYARLAGLFAQNYSHWQPPPLHARGTDVLHLPINPTGSLAVKQALGRHNKALAVSLRYLNHAYPSLRVKLLAADAKDLGALLKHLFDSKLFISPMGMGEVTELDHLAIMCGCLVVKARGQGFVALPDVFKHEETGAAVNPDWSNLRSSITALLQDLPGSQFMASKAFHRLLEFADTQRYAGQLARTLTRVFSQLGPAKLSLIQSGLAANATKSLEFLP